MSRPELAHPSSLHALYGSALFNYFTQISPHLAQWQTQLPPQLHPPAPPAPHKVWIIDCNCGTFLTNRAMKAVLLLRPNVSLFSSDALPVNCSAFTSNPDALRVPSCLSQFPGRTCECLTQSLCCHGCGSTIGYMILIPCTRCTTSVSANHRHTNGHRFVFHSSEVVGTERLYVPDEPGVIPWEITPASLTQASNPTSSPFASFIPAAHLDDSPPSLEVANLSPISFASPSLTGPFHDSQPFSPSLSSESSSTGMSSGPLLQHIALKAGDTLYWHHLLHQGELPGVSDNPRARGSSIAKKMVFDR